MFNLEWFSEIENFGKLHILFEKIYVLSRNILHVNQN